jgi:DNA polymerase I-like protein with 3'-5' exonuclease and polymerase domains
VAGGYPAAPILITMLHDPGDAMLKWLWQTLGHVGIRSTDVRLVYMLDEPPLGAHGRPTQVQLRNNWERFKAEVEESHPRVVVAAGPYPFQAMTGQHEDINDARGYLIPSSLWGTVERAVWTQVGEYKTTNAARGITKGDPRFKLVKQAAPPILPLDYTGYVIPTFDLHHIRTDGFSITPAFHFDMDRALRAITGDLDVIDEGFTYFTSLDSPEARAPYGTGLVAMDIETPRDSPQVLRISLSDGTRTHTLPWDEDTRRWVLEQVNSPGKMLCFHNHPFDIPRLAQAGCQVPDWAPVFDTMLAGVVLQPDLHKGLGRMAPCYMDTLPWKWRRLADSDPEFYSAKDAFCTVLLAQRLITLLKNLGMYDLFMGGNSYPGPGVMKTARFALMPATVEGIKLNRPAARDWCGRLSNELLALHATWSEQFPSTNPNSTRDLQRLFYRDWQLPIIRTREDGITVNELALMKLREVVTQKPAVATEPLPYENDQRCKPELFDLILAIRAAGKNLKTYVTPVAESATAYVHPSYLPESKDSEQRVGDKGKRKGNTATGRLASSNPNIQNQPKEVRVLYVPDTDNDVIVQGDYKAAELQVFAYLAGDLTLQDDLRGNLHQRNADRLQTDRKTAKNIIYATQYLAGPQKISDMILGQQHFYVPPDECDRIQKGYDAIYHKVTAYKRMIVDQCKNQGYIVNPFGRYRFFHHRHAPAAVDFIPQSTVADILWCVLLPVAEKVRSLGGRLLTTVHDSIVVQVPQARVDECCAEMKRLMERQFDNVSPGFFIPVDFETARPGGSWAEVKPYVWPS